jgi:hypothetical protein
MSTIVPAVAFLMERHGPTPAGYFGLSVALLLIVLLVARQLRESWSDHAPPGPLPVREPDSARDGRALHWAVVLVLLAVLVIVVLERLVVLA